MGVCEIKKRERRGRGIYMRPIARALGLRPSIDSNISKGSDERSSVDESTIQG
jgi:hypothetical protein